MVWIVLFIEIFLVGRSVVIICGCVSLPTEFVHVVLNIDELFICVTFQLQSFEAELSVPAISAEEGGPETFRAVFIRAPAILEVGADVEVLADYSVSSVQPPSLKSDEESLEVSWTIYFCC